MSTTELIETVTLSDWEKSSLSEWIPKAEKTKTSLLPGITDRKWSVIILFSRDCRSLVWVNLSLRCTWKQYMVAYMKRNETLHRTDLGVVLFVGTSCCITTKWILKQTKVSVNLALLFTENKCIERITPMHDLYIPTLCNDLGSIDALLLSENIHTYVLHRNTLFNQIILFFMVCIKLKTLVCTTLSILNTDLWERLESAAITNTIYIQKSVLKILIKASDAT